MQFLKTRKAKIILIILVVLIAIRLALPWFITRYVNKVLAELPGYTGSIEDVDVRLYRGAYQVHQLKLLKLEGNHEIPFVDIPTMDLSIEWKALFKGSLVGEIVFTSPTLNFIGGGSEQDQYGEDVDWTKPIKELFPLRINRLEIRDGKITFYDFTTKPSVDLYLSHVEAIASNLSNVENEDELLPTTINATATSIGDGQLSITMKMNVLKQVPDLDLDLKFENVDMPSLNQFFDAYAKVDVESGNFDLYTELAIVDGEVTGYVKPMIEKLKVVDWENDKQKPLRFIWENIVGFLAEAFENQPRNSFATKVPLTGTVKNVNTSTWPAIWNIFKNAFIKAFEKNTDGTIHVGSTPVEKTGE